MKSFVLISAVAAVSFGSYAAHQFGHGHVFGHGLSGAEPRGHVHVHSYQSGQSAPLVQTVRHASSPGGEYATSGDLLGLHSFGYDGVSLDHSVHGQFLPVYGGHSTGFPVDYGLPQRSKLYGGYVGGFGGYAKGALDSIQHLNQGSLKLQAPLVEYESHKIAAPVSFGHAAQLPQLSHESQSHYEGQHGVSGIGGPHYGLEYKKAKA